MKSMDDGLISGKLDTLIALSRNMLALELWRSGASKEEIGKRLHIAKSTVVEMLQGVNRGRESHD